MATKGLETRGRPEDASIAPLLSFLSDDQDKALARIEHIRRALCVMARNRCARRRLHLDPDDLVQDTILRVAELASRQTLTPDNPEGYFARTLDFIIREALRERRHEPLIPDPPEPFREPELLRTGCAGVCFRGLQERERQILQDYFEEKHRDVLAAELNTTNGALRVRIHELRRRLRACVEKCEHGEEGRV